MEDRTSCRRSRHRGGGLQNTKFREDGSTVGSAKAAGSGLTINDHTTSTSSGQTSAGAALSKKHTENTQSIINAQSSNGGGDDNSSAVDTTGMVPGSYSVEGPGGRTNAANAMIGYEGTSSQPTTENTSIISSTMIPVAIPAQVVDDGEVIVAERADDKPNEAFTSQQGKVQVHYKWLVCGACLLAAVSVGVAAGVAVALMNDNGNKDNPIPQDAIPSPDLVGIRPKPQPELDLATTPTANPTDSPPEVGPIPSPTMKPTKSQAEAGLTSSPTASPSAQQPAFKPTSSPTVTSILENPASNASLSNCLCWYYHQQIHWTDPNQSTLTEQQQNDMAGIWRGRLNQYDPYAARRLRSRPSHQELKRNHLQRRLPAEGDILAQGGTELGFTVVSQVLFGDFQSSIKSGLDMYYRLLYCKVDATDDMLQQYHDAYLSWMGVLENRFSIVASLQQEVGLVSATNLTLPDRATDSCL